MQNRRPRIVWIVAAIIALVAVVQFGPYLFFQIACRIAYCDM
jgi:uncharacterized membrane protein